MEIIISLIYLLVFALASLVIAPIYLLFQKKFHKKWWEEERQTKSGDDAITDAEITMRALSGEGAYSGGH